MRKTFFAAVLLIPVTAFAATDDDYVSCLVGQSAVALLNSEAKTAEEAQRLAYAACPQPDLPEDVDLDGLEDMVNIMVERMAAE